MYTTELVAVSMDGLWVYGQESPKIKIIVDGEHAHTHTYRTDRYTFLDSVMVHSTEYFVILY